jgi:hypothetical protein
MLVRADEEVVLAVPVHVARVDEADPEVASSRGARAVDPRDRVAVGGR